MRATGEVGWSAEIRAELRLPALALRDHHQPFGNRQSELRPMVLAYQGQSQVDARRHACGGDQPAVAHVDGVGFDLGGREVACQLLGIAPVCGNTLATSSACTPSCMANAILRVMMGFPAEHDGR